MEGSVIKFAFVFCTLIHMTVAHLCLITPRQRGDMDISEGGSHTCFRHGAPCGGEPPEFPPKINLEAGRPVFIKWQQNYNHYSVGYPGYMDIAIAVANDVAKLDHVTDAPDPFRVLAVVADKDEYDQANQRNYTAVVTLPNVECQHCVIRARYVAHKPGETTFYQCADVAITTSPSVQALPQKSSKYPSLFMPGPVMLPQSPIVKNQDRTMKSPLVPIQSENSDIINAVMNSDNSVNIDTGNRQFITDASTVGVENLKKAIDFTNSDTNDFASQDTQMPDSVTSRTIDDETDTHLRANVVNKPMKMDLENENVKELPSLEQAVSNSDGGYSSLNLARSRHVFPTLSDEYGEIEREQYDEHSNPKFINVPYLFQGKSVAIDNEDEGYLGTEFPIKPTQNTAEEGQERHDINERTSFPDIENQHSDFQEEYSSFDVSEPNDIATEQIEKDSDVQKEGYEYDPQAKFVDEPYHLEGKGVAMGYETEEYSGTGLPIKPTQNTMEERQERPNMNDRASFSKHVDQMPNFDEEYSSSIDQIEERDDFRQAELVNDPHLIEENSAGRNEDDGLYSGTVSPTHNTIEEGQEIPDTGEQETIVNPGDQLPTFEEKYSSSFGMSSPRASDATQLDRNSDDRREVYEAYPQTEYVSEPFPSEENSADIYEGDEQTQNKDESNVRLPSFPPAVPMWSNSEEDSSSDIVTELPGVVKQTDGNDEYSKAEILDSPGQIKMDIEEDKAIPTNWGTFTTPNSFLAQNDLHASTKSNAKIYGMSNNINYPGNADLLTFDTVSGIRYDVAPLMFRVDSPLFDGNGIRRGRLNSSLDYVTDGVLTLDSGRGVAVMPMNRHNNMDDVANTFVEMDMVGGAVKNVYDVMSGKNKTLPLRSAFSAAIVEIEGSYVTFNIEPDEKETGKYNFVVGRLYAGGSWVMLSKTNQSEDTFINFMWADYDISVKTLYVLLGNENDALGLSARLYKFFVMPGPPPVQPSTDSSSYVTLDVSKYPFMAFHFHPDHSNLLYAVSPGLHNMTTPSYHLVVVDVDLGTVKEEMQITPPGIFERFYGGAIINGLSSFPPQLLHVLRVANTEADVIMTIDLNKKTASFSQVTNLRNVYSLYAVF